MNNEGAFHLSLGEVDKAKRCFDAAGRRYGITTDGATGDEVCSGAYPILFNIALLLAQIGGSSNRRRATAILRRLVGFDVVHADVLVRLAQLEHEDAKGDERKQMDAERLLATAAAIDPCCTTAGLILARWVRREQGTNAAIEMLRRLHDQLPEGQGRHRSVFSLEMGNVYHQNAHAHYVGTAATKPRSEKFHKKIHYSLTLFLEGLRENPQNIAAANNAACSLSQMGDHANALAILQRVLVTPSVLGQELRDATQHNLANVYVELGRSSPAMRACLTLMQSPSGCGADAREYVAVALNLAKAQTLSEAFEDAVITLQRAVREDPHNPLLHQNLALVRLCAVYSLVKPLHTSTSAKKDSANLTLAHCAQLEAQLCAAQAVFQSLRVRLQSGDKIAAVLDPRVIEQCHLSLQLAFSSLDGVRRLLGKKAEQTQRATQQLRETLEQSRRALGDSQQRRQREEGQLQERLQERSKPQEERLRHSLSSWDMDHPPMDKAAQRRSQGGGASARPTATTRGGDRWLGDHDSETDSEEQALEYGDAPAAKRTRH